MVETELAQPEIKISQVTRDSNSQNSAVELSVAEVKEDMVAEIPVETKEEVAEPKPEKEEKADDSILDIVPEKESAEVKKEETVKTKEEAVDYKSMYEQAVAEREEITNKVKSYEGDVNHEAVKHLKEYLDKGGNPADYYKAQTIDADTIPADTLIEDFYKRKNPDYDSMMIEVGLEDKFGVGQDIDALIAEAKENMDRTELSRLITIKENRLLAQTEQKAFLREQKNTLLTPKEAEKTGYSDEEVQALKAEFDKGLKAQIDGIKDIKVGNWKVPVKPGDLKADRVVMKDNGSGLLYVNGVDEKTLLEALYVYENMGSIQGAIEKKYNVEAEKKSDTIYNHSQESQIKPSITPNTSIKITQLS